MNTRDIPKYKDPSLTHSERLKDLMRNMNIQQKIHQLLIYHSRFLDLDTSKEYSRQTLPAALTDKLDNGLGNIFHFSTTAAPEVQAKNANLLQKYILEKSQLGIPLLFQCESLHGLISKDSTSFPQSIGLSSSWDPDLARRISSAIALETRSRGMHISYAPLLDIATDPRWGRFQETFGEDPYLTSVLGRETILGYQGSGKTRLDKDHIASAAKHFAGYGQLDGGRNFAPSHITRRDLMDRILKPFKTAVKEAGLAGIMPAHQEIDGVPCHGNYWLLQTILRHTWGFTGFIVSDADDIYRLEHLHSTALDQEDALTQALKNGISLDIGSSRTYNDLFPVIEKNPKLEKDLDFAVEKILSLKFQLGLFEHPYVDTGRTVTVNHINKHRSLAREAADKSIVLLENKNNFLPLRKDKIKSIAVIGPNAYAPPVGTYTSAETPELTISLHQGMKEKATELNIQYHFAQGCYINTMDRYESKIHETEMDEEAVGNIRNNPALISDTENQPYLDEAVEAAQKADVAVVCVGENLWTDREAIYAGDSRGDRDQLDLAGSQNKLVQAVAETGTPIILALYNGRPLAARSAYESAEAVLECWYPGCEGGSSIADIIFGDVNPSGKLTCSIPRGVGQLPVHYNQKPTGMFRNYLFVENGPLYPFGYGLTYTEFNYSNVRIDTKTVGPDQTLTIAVNVTNTGNFDGDEIVQLYIRDEKASVTRPVKELKGFQRVHLKQGETKQVDFQITPEQDLTFCGVDYKTVVEDGFFTIMVGPHSEEYITDRFEVKTTGAAK